MNCFRTTRYFAPLLFILMACSSYASVETIGPNGINSAGLSLPNGTPLTGAGIGIGQVEVKRPSDPTQPNGMPFDTTGSLVNSSVDPEEVFFARYTNPSNPSGAVTFGATMNDPMGDEASGPNGLHAVEVAGVMISTDTQATGVSTGAKLYSIGHNATANFQESAALRTQFIAQQNSGDIRAINMSFKTTISGSNALDGNSLFTQFVDWSAAKHDVLYVVAGNQQGTGGFPIPTDNFNGMTIASSVKVGNVFRQVSTGNTYNEDAVGDRTSIDLIAPGDGILLASQGNTNVTQNGTSFAAPHVTGTVALLQEYGDFQVTAGAADWGGLFEGKPTARRHEVMKTVLMNSADKVAGILGSTRTVLDSNGNDWFDASNPAATNAAIPLHPEFGAGQLNAERALTQFSAGEFDANGADVPIIGWDYGLSTGVAGENRYALDQPLQEDSYLSVTLTWDRLVAFDNDTGITGAYDIDDTFEAYEDLEDVMIDMDILLVRRGDDLQQDPIVAASYGNVTFDGGYNLEHLFFKIPSTEQYDIVIEVVNNGVPINFAPQGFGIAWWGETDAITQLNGDFDSDNDVDGADFLAWQRDTALGNLADWESDFGSSGALAAATAVPEPATGRLLMMGLIFATQAGPRRCYSKISC